MKCLLLASLLLGSVATALPRMGRESGGAEGVTVGQGLWSHLTAERFTVFRSRAGRPMIEARDLTCARGAREHFRCRAVDRPTGRTIVFRSPSFGNFLADAIIDRPGTLGFYGIPGAAEFRVANLV